MTDERLVIGENGVPRPNPAMPQVPPEEGSEEFRGDPITRRVVSYLLRQMSEEESGQFEDECYAQEFWPFQVQLVEDDLIDAYLHDELEPEQRGLFERNYLTTKARQERVRVAAALLNQFCEREIAVEPPVVEREKGKWAERLKAFWAGHPWGLHAVFAMTALILVVGGSWFFLSRVRAPRAVATVRLTSSIINRSEGTEARTVKLPPDAGALRVFLTLPVRATPAQHYRVELDDEEGETTNLAVEGQDTQAVSVLIPTSRLSRGQQYVLTLFPLRDDGTEQPAHGSYIFAVE